MTIFTAQAKDTIDPTGLVPKPSSEVAEDGEVLGTVHHHGRVRALRGHGATLAAATGDDPQER